MLFLSGRIKLPLDVTIQRPHHAYPGKHHRATALGNQQKRFHRGLPFFGIVFGLGEFGDVGCGVAERDELLAFGQFDGIEKWLVPRQVSPRPALGYPAAPLAVRHARGTAPAGQNNKSARFCRLVVISERTKMASP